VLYFTLVYHLTKLYGAKNADLESFILISGGIYTVPVLGRLGRDRRPAAARHHLPPGVQQGSQLDRRRLRLVIVGGLAAMYVIIIGSQAYPQEMFPGKTVLEFGAPGRRRRCRRALRAELPGAAARDRRRRRGHADHRRRHPGAAVPAGIARGPETRALPARCRRTEQNLAIRPPMPCRIST
jgi:hypothetical protein